MKTIERSILLLTAIMTIIVVTATMANCKCLLSAYESKIEPPTNFKCKNNQCSTIQATEAKKQCEVGDILEFGSYPYYEEGTEKPIEWQILEKYEDGTALILTRNVIDNISYNDRLEETSWETSSIRKWLNEYFYNKAFSLNEKKLIKETYLHEEGTKDRIFMLSREEAEKYFTATPEKTLFLAPIKQEYPYYSKNQSRSAYPTPYAKNKENKGKKLYTNNYTGGTCWWWLRSFNKDSRASFSCIYYGGEMSFCLADSNSTGVRPALTISVKNIKTEKYLKQKIQ